VNEAEYLDAIQQLFKPWLISLDQRHAEIRAQLEKLLGRPSEN
jgi:hypothetical protein